ncbi:MAG: winged helix-turn-helix domain-containing protein [Spirochaetales bacterium]|nr:winged helix-turn-helix domain-containing protein [Spirochaetales bacterium]
MYYGIWGKAGIGSRSVDMHISSLRKKLASLQRSVPAERRLEIKTARGAGYAIR